jgi:radical SAM superfamily enzyme YgiQ (UPF0313 family)
VRNSPRAIAFVHAPMVFDEQNFGVRYIPLWAYTLAAYVPDDWDVSIHDCTRYAPSEIPGADVFAFSGINQDLESIRDAHRILKALYPDAIFILGGPICWSFDKDGRLDDLAAFDHLNLLDGEQALPDFLAALSSGQKPPRIIRADRFPIGGARKLRFDLLQPVVKQYYGGIVEVSRGCPFLCEFCDIRVLPNNNEAHNKDVALIVSELQAYHALGVRRVQLACDNFVGDLVWARECVDAILAWVESTGAEMALYTWATVNISRMPELLVKMRRAGFTTFFIGVESFNANSILETAKVQNSNDSLQMISALRSIQSFGFIIAPGLIFGFDSDPPSMFEDMVAGVMDAGLIGGDPTFLLALAGTPLYDRMKRTGRLVEDDSDDDADLPLHKKRVSKIESNIRYLQPRQFMVRGFIEFMRRFTDPDVMYARFRTHMLMMMESPNFIPVHTVGYGGVGEYFKFQIASWRSIGVTAERLARLARPRMVWAVIKAAALVVRYWRKYPAAKNHFTFWLFVWSNLLVKYPNLREEDFKIQSLSEDYRLDRLWEEMSYTDPGLSARGRNADNVKVANQLRSTQGAIARLRKVWGVEYNRSDFDT